MTIPTCGRQSAAPTATSTTDQVIGALLTAAGIPASIAGVVAFLGKFNAVLVVLSGVSITYGMAAGIGGAAVGVLIVVGAFALSRLRPRPGLVTCWAGVVNGLEEAFASASEWVFPFTAMHDRVDVVVKSRYWPLVQQNSGFVHCAGDAENSPLLRCFYKSREVVGAVTGSMYGAAVGAPLGAVVGVVVAAALCVTVVLCILGIILGALIAAAGGLVGAFAGGMIGKALGGGNTDPSDSASGGGVRPGHYVTMTGNLIADPDSDGAVVAWWVHRTTVHGGPSVGGDGPAGGPPYRYTDPDANLPVDACPLKPSGSPDPR